jgi:hypothetical protein
MMALIAGVIAMPAMRARVAGIARQAVTGELDSLLSIARFHGPPRLR